MKLMYLRKSRADNPYETVEEVLARHEAILQEYAVSRYGEPIPEKNIYREVVSGESIENRPEMQTVLRRIESPEIDSVLVVDPQRLSRGDLIDCGQLMQAFKYSRTVIETPGRTFDLWDKFDEKMVRDELMRGRESLEYAKEVMARGRKLSTAEGWYPGSTAPFGYDFEHVMAGKKRRQTLKPNPEEAEAVRHIFEWFVYLGYSLYKICRRLDELGFKPRRAEHFSADAVRTVLQNPVYTGKIAVGRRDKVESLVEGKIVVSRPRADAKHVFEGRHHAIISDELFDMAQQRFGTLPKIKGSTELRNPLAGLIKCQCGYNMTYHSDKRSGPRLLCTHQLYCKTRSVSFDAVYNDVIEKLRETAEDFTVKIESGVDIAVQKYKEELEQMRVALSDMDAQQDRLFTFLESGTYDEATFRQRNALLVERRAALREKYEEMKAHTPPVVDYKEVAGTLHEAIEAMKADYLSAQQKNDFLKEVVHEIIYTQLPPIDDGSRWGIAQYQLDIHLRD